MMSEAPHVFQATDDKGAKSSVVVMEDTGNVPPGHRGQRLPPHHSLQTAQTHHTVGHKKVSCLVNVMCSSFTSVP